MTRSTYGCSAEALVDGLIELPSLHHLHTLTDHVGIVQHARFSEPNYDEGYSIDDNARALILMCELAQLTECVAVDQAALATRYLTYINEGWNPRCQRFRNFRSADRRWLEEQGSEDSHGRAVYALGHAANCAPWSEIKTSARRAFDDALPSTNGFTSPRAWAFALLGIEEYLQSGEDRCGAAGSRNLLAQRLLHLYQATATVEWRWFENILSYCNAKLPHALLRSGHALGRDDMIGVALGALSWLAEVHGADEGHFVPIGSNGFYPKDGDRAVFDQQPIEAHASVAASLDAYRLTSDNFWLDEAKRAHQWFLGGNDAGIPIADPKIGACYDGLHSDRVNLNQGAESTLAYLLSSTDMRRPRGGAARSRPETPCREAGSLSPPEVDYAAAQLPSRDSLRTA